MALVISAKSELGAKRGFHGSSVAFQIGDDVTGGEIDVLGRAQRKRIISSDFEQASPDTGDLRQRQTHLPAGRRRIGHVELGEHGRRRKIPRSSSASAMGLYKRTATVGVNTGASVPKRPAHGHRASWSPLPWPPSALDREWVVNGRVCPGQRRRFVRGRVDTLHSVSVRVRDSSSNHAAAARLVNSAEAPPFEEESPNQELPAS